MIGYECGLSQNLLNDLRWAKQLEPNKVDSKRLEAAADGEASISSAQEPN